MSVILTASDPIKKTISNISTTMQASILAIASLATYRDAV
jgi:hypothetical protein